MAEEEWMLESSNWGEHDSEHEGSDQAGGFFEQPVEVADQQWMPGLQAINGWFPFHGDWRWVSWRAGEPAAAADYQLLRTYTNLHGCLICDGAIYGRSPYMSQINLPLCWTCTKLFELH